MGVLPILFLVLILRARRALGTPFPSFQAPQGWGLIDLLLRAAFSPAHPPADISHPPNPPIALQSISRDVPLARARAFQFSSSLVRKWPRLPFPARIERAPFHRARSASKKGTWPLPPPPSEAARCASTEDQQPPSSPLSAPATTPMEELQLLLSQLESLR